MMEETGWKHYLRLILNIIIPLTGWLLICLLGPKLLRFFMPFVIGWVIAMIANPLVRFLERRVKLVRRHSSIVIVAAALALVIGLLYLLVSRTFVLLRQFIMDLPGLYAGIEGDVARSMEQLEHLFDFMPDSIQQSWAQFGNNLGSYMGTVVEKIASPTVEAAGTVAKSLPAILVYTVVTILSAYFFIVDRDRILAVIKAHTPQWAGHYGLYLKGEVRHLIGSYFMAQFKIMAVVWLILTVGFLVLGVGCFPGFPACVWNRNSPSSVGAYQASGRRVRLCGRAAAYIRINPGNQTDCTAEAGGRQYGPAPPYHAVFAVSGI